MVAMIEQVIEIYQLYSGSSLYMTFFLCALFYLWLTEEEKGKRVVLVYVSICLVALFFFPLFSYLMIHTVLEEGVYYRVLWFFPVGIVVAYSAVKLISGQKKVVRKVIIFIMACLMLLSGGDYTYDHPTFEPAENAYHLPQTVIDICDEIKPETDDYWVCAVMPQELLSYVRQYTSMIHMPYGRAVLITRWNLGHPLYDTMEADVIDAKTLAEQAREYGCHYIVLNETRGMEGSLEKQDFEVIAEIDGYRIYLDQNNSLGL